MIAIYTWTGDSFAPLPRFAKACDKTFVVHERYQMEAIEERSAVSHRHFFAALHDAWLNLGEEDAEHFQTSEHLRKWALIKAGFADTRSITCASKAEAQRVAAFIRPMDGFAVVDVREATIKVYTAQSQSMKAMGKEPFQSSKQAVLDIVSGMIGTDRKTLSAQSCVANMSQADMPRQAPQRPKGAPRQPNAISPRAALANARAKQREA